MAITYQNKSEHTEPLDSSFTMTIPTGFSAGDLLIACVHKDDDPSITIPSGWTIIEEGTDGVYNIMYFSVAYRIAESGDTNWTWTADGEAWAGVILRYTGQAVTSPIHASGKAGGYSTNPTAPSVGYTDLANDSITLQCFGSDWITPFTVPGQLTERFSFDNGDGGLAGGDKVISGTSSTGTAIFTQGSTRTFLAVTVVIDAEPTIQELYDTVTDTIVNSLSTGMEFVLSHSISGTHTSTLEGLSFGTTKSLTESSSLTVPSLAFGSTRTLTSSCTPALSKLLTLILSQSFTESSNLSAQSKFILESSLSGTYIPITDLLILLAAISTSSTSIPTLSKVLIYHLISSFQLSSTFSSFIKFILEKATTSSYTPIVTDIYTLIDLVFTTINNIPGVFCKFKLIISNTGLGTPSVSSILGKFDIVSFEIQGTSSLTKVMNYSPIITVEISEQFFIDAFQTLIKNVTSTTTGVPTASRKDLLEILFTEISILSSLVKFSLEQNLIQTNTATVDKIISFIKDIEMSSTSSLSIEDILEFILTVSLSTSQNTTVEDIQILIDLISTSTQENLSISTKNILSILLQETSIFSSILKFFIVKTITNDILSTINIAVSYRDTMLLTIENILLVTLLEELAKLILILEDSQITNLILEDSQITNLILEDSQITNLILEDL